MNNAISRILIDFYNAKKKKKKKKKNRNSYQCNLDPDNVSTKKPKKTGISVVSSSEQKA